MNELHEHPADPFSQSPIDSGDPMRDLLVHALDENSENPDLSRLLLAYFQALGSKPEV